MKLLLLTIACGTALVACADPPRSQPQAPSGSTDVTHAYACGGSGTFTPQDIARETQPSREILEAIDRLRQTIDGSQLPAEGWFAVSREGLQETLLAPSNHHYARASFEKRDGQWKPVGWGDCIPRLEVPDKSVLRWAFSQGSYPPESEAQELFLLVSEVQCSSGRAIDDLIEAEVTYQEHTISVILTAPGLSGSKNTVHTCIGTAPTEYELLLNEPVADRQVIDLSVYPPAEPTPGTQLP